MNATSRTIVERSRSIRPIFSWMVHPPTHPQVAGHHRGRVGEDDDKEGHAPHEEPQEEEKGSNPGMPG